MSATHERKLDITPEEYKKIEQSLKNDEFRNLFMDYMKEISDPENRKLYEQEIAQLEAERGNNIRFINPTPGYVVKTSFSGGEHKGQKAFINICTSPEIAEATIGTTVKGKGQNWCIPYSLAQPREDVDHAKNKCMVYDCVFHPETYAKGKRSAGFDRMLVSTAMEGVERQFKVKLERKYKTPKMHYKGTPVPTVIRTPDPTLSPKSDTTTEYLDRLKADQEAKTTLPSLTLTPPAQKKPLIEELPPQDTPVTAAAAEQTPTYSIIHRVGNSDYQRYTQEREKQYGARPDALVVKIALPGVASASQVDLDPTTTHLSLRVPQKYSANIALPFPVVHSDGNAKFDKTKQELVVTLPVVPAPKIALPESDAPFEADEVVTPAGSDDGEGWVKIEPPVEIEIVGDVPSQEANHQEEPVSGDKENDADVVDAVVVPLESKPGTPEEPSTDENKPVDEPMPKMEETDPKPKTGTSGILKFVNTLMYDLDD